MLDTNLPDAQQKFRSLLSRITQVIQGKDLDSDLELLLNKEYGVHSVDYLELKTLCEIGLQEGWLCQRSGGGIRYGRIFKPAEDLAGFSVDVVEMENIAGPHHTHPLGEIDLIMPVEGAAVFDNHPAGWMVAPVGSSHFPTVSNGKAFVLYLLPQGKIEFTDVNKA